MKKSFTLRNWLATLLLCMGGGAYASHEAGVEITYTCQNACTTRINLKAYRDCTGVNSIGNNLTFNVLSGSGCSSPTAVTGWSTLSQIEVTPICPSAATQCTTPGAPINGVQEYSWYRDYNICSSPNCVFQIVWSDCCRNPIITSLSGPGSQGITTANSTLNTGLGSCNNSPTYTNIPLFYACAGQDYYVHQGAMDMDGDSLSYALGTCYNTVGVPVTYNSGFSALAPLGPTWNVSLDPVTGILHLDANPGNMEVGVMCILVNEWRNGQLIATSARDIQIIVTNCGTNVNPTLASPSNLSGATATGDDVYVNAGSAFCFDLAVTDANSGQNLRLWWDANSTSAQFYDPGNVLVQDTIPGTSSTPPTGRFCWTPSATGTYQFKFRVEDNYCPVYGFVEKIVTVHVGTCGSATASATPGTCPGVNFTSSACFSGPYTYAWSGSGGFSSTVQNPTYTYAGPGTYSWQVIVSNGTLSDTVSGTVVVGSGPSSTNLIGGVAFVSPCTGNLYDTLDAGSGYTSYLWSTGATTQTLPVFIGGNYSVTVSSANGCQYTDTETLFWTEPDIYGVVTTSTGGALQNQRVLLIQHDTTAQALWAVDSTWTDSLGYYFFCNVTDTLVFLKATPLALDYPNQMPTYADTTLFWNNAIQFQGVLQAPFRHDFNTLNGTNPGGPGFIGGLIVQGANKTNGIGDPIIGLTVFLRDRNTGNYLGSRVTDANGYFIFSGIPYGDYEVVPDRPLVSTTNVPQVTLDAQHPGYNNLDFQMHRYWLELVMPTGVPVPGALQAQVAPNPFGEHASLLLELPNATVVSWELYDELGRKLQAGAAMEMGAGRHRVEVGQNLPSGLYLLNVHVGGSLQQARLVKMN